MGQIFLAEYMISSTSTITQLLNTHLLKHGDLRKSGKPNDLGCAILQ